jgi:AcrR family transcriptional regulator
MYNHSPDRESLLVAFVEEEASRYVERLRAAVAATDEPVERLATDVRLRLRGLAEDHLPPGPAPASALAPSVYRRISAHADPITEQLRGILTGGARAGRWPAEETEVLIPMITSALTARQVVDVPSEQLDDALEAAVRFVLRAIGAGLGPFDELGTA